MSETYEQKSDISWPSVLQAVLSGAAALVSWGITALVMIGVVGELVNPSGDRYLLSSLLSLILAGALMGSLFTGSLFFSLMRLVGRKIAFGSWWTALRAMLHPKRLIIAYPLVLGLGYLANQTSLSRNIVLPLLNILSLTIPVIVLVWLALRGLPKGSYQLGWGAFSLGLAIGPTVVLTLELVGIVVMVIGLAISVGANPDLMEAVTEIGRLSFEADNPYLVDEAVGGLLSRPQVLLSILAYLAGFVPLVEELFKPISVWVLLGRKLRPVDGWVIGALSGAGFAIFESLSQATVDAGWWLGVVGRLGASIPHVFTTAFMGYTLALARNQKRYGRVLPVFLGVVAIHSLWNASSVMAMVTSLGAPGGILSEDWTLFFVAMIIALGLGMVIALLRINHKLRSEMVTTSPDEVLPAASLSPNLEPGSKETYLDGPDHNAN
jgi:RsiW-degrading membrane proteinase PrsW (M82 family)